MNPDQKNPTPLDLWLEKQWTSIVGLPNTLRNKRYIAAMLALAIIGTAGILGEEWVKDARLTNGSKAGNLPSTDPTDAYQVNSPSSSIEPGSSKNATRQSKDNETPDIDACSAPFNERPIECLKP